MIKNILIWTLAVTVAVVSATSALGAIAKNKRPEFALSLQPTNGFAAGKAASKLTKTEISKLQGVFPDRLDPEWAALASQAFRQEPTASDAIAVMALARTGSVRQRLMAKAFDLSRRQSLVTGWMVTDSGDKNDIPSFLSYYDVSLRTSPSAAAIIIPTMAGALADDNFIEPFATMLLKNPPWAGDFWAQVVRRPEVIINAAKLRQILYQPVEPFGVYRDSAMIDELLKNRHFKTAERLHALVSDTKNRETIIRNSDFSKQSKYPPIDWRLYSTGEYGASIEQDSLAVSAIRNSGGLLARQLVKLPNNILDLKAEFDREIPRESTIFIGLSCAEIVDNRPEAIRIPVEKKSTQFKISNENSQCEYYWLDFTARAADSGDGLDIRMESISLSVINN
ncbi:hypothetical protein [Sphingorhabdus sp. Alg231-15]|uniref:hypothetical protein n=1 Tax=Sphingorhabdus sp. Alg231-15 TaxID=1922222 RepID=UPI000D55420B